MVTSPPHPHVKPLPLLVSLFKKFYKSPPLPFSLPPISLSPLVRSSSSSSSSLSLLLSRFQISAIFLRKAMAMQRVRCRPLAGGDMVAVAAAAAATAAAGTGGKRRGAALSIDGAEPPEKWIERLIGENPVVIFSRRGCCMCHVMKRLLATLGVHPTVMELEEAEETAAAAAAAAVGLPALFIGGAPVGGLEGLMALHLRGLLVPRLREVGALWG